MNRTLRKLGCLVTASTLIVSMAACSSKAPDKSPETLAESTSGAQTAGENSETKESTSDTKQPTDSESTADSESSSSAPVSSSYSDMPVKEPEVSQKDSNYYQELLDTETYNYKLIRNVPTAYEEQSWDTYCSAANILLTVDPEKISDVQKELIDKAAAARENLVQINSAKDCMWYLWDENMPMAEPAESLQFTVESYDNSDFRPFLVPYVLEDQSHVKGNMIIIAGGGYSSRGNSGEGYPIAEGFNERGYNCYVLQRRVAPYSTEDIWMDMQRSIRYVRHMTDQMQLGGADNICAAGFSGGSGTILGAIAKYYGDVSPTISDSSYTPDEIDALSSDLDTALCLYGPNYAGTPDYQGLVTENPNIPALFVAVGANDETGAVPDCHTLIQSVSDQVMTELHTFANVGHGFGIGLDGTNSVLWMDMADLFLQQVTAGGKASSENSAAAEAAEIPEEYIKSQTYSATFGFGDAQVTCAVNEDGSKFYAYFTAFNELQVLEGIVDENGIVTVTYDKSGFMKGDAQMIYDLADPDGWTPIS